MDNSDTGKLQYFDCTACQKRWSRPSTRGKPPILCPECRSTGKQPVRFSSGALVSLPTPKPAQEPAKPLTRASVAYAHLLTGESNGVRFNLSKTVIFADSVGCDTCGKPELNGLRWNKTTRSFACSKHLGESRLAPIVDNVVDSNDIVASDGDEKEMEIAA